MIISNQYSWIYCLLSVAFGSTGELPTGTDNGGEYTEIE
jgi:hypothetical protein